MSIFCLGDLVLDVIVRLEQPLATGADATSRIVLRPGGQAANVAAWIAALGGSSHFVGKRGADDAGAIAASRLRDLGVGLARAGRADRERGHRRARRPVGRAHHVPRPGRRRRAPPRGDRARRGSWTATTCTCRATRCCASPSASPRRARSNAPAVAAPGQRRPLVVERDPRRRRRTLPLPARSARARCRLRQRGGGRDRRRPDRRRHLDPQARRRGARRSTATSVAAVPGRVDRRHDRRRRCLRRRLARRRAGAGARSRRPLRAARRIDARARRARLAGDARPDPRQRRGADGARGGARRRRARDDARRARIPGAGRRRDGPRERGGRPRRRSRSGDDRRPRRADPDRPRAPPSSSGSRRLPASSARATSPSAPSRVRSARRRSAAR